MQWVDSIVDTVLVPYSYMQWVDSIVDTVLVPYICLNRMDMNAATARIA
jgi:uncharacterized protein YceK